MAGLSLRLLGPFDAKLGGESITGFKSNKVRALLAYLMVESGKAHRRESLAGLLWPEWPNREALSNLRYTLSDLRRVIGDRTAEPSYLLISRDSLQFNTESDHELDVREFEVYAESEVGARSKVEELEKAIELYQGSFLEGFTLDGSPEFDEWALLKREQLARKASSTLHRLSRTYEERGDYEKAQAYMWKQLEVEPWDEVAYRQLMRMLALGGQRGAALAQYEACKEALAGELGVEPARETRELYEQIRGGRMKPVDTPTSVLPDQEVRLPSFLQDETDHPETPAIFAREEELYRLNAYLEETLGGVSRVVLVTGETGSGKTALINEFTRQALEGYKDLLIASGDCNAYTGIGDPYLPFREILELLTGDVEARWAAGAVSREHALRLWNNLPEAIQALMDTGADLIDTFVQRESLVERAKTFSPESPNMMKRLEAFLARKSTAAMSAAGSHQIDLFDQYKKILLSLESNYPLLLIVDDLQWADAGSINLLFHLGRRLTGSKIMILGAYRSEEVALGRDGERHPLEPVVNELRRDFGDIIVNLGKTKGQDFIDAFLDNEPNLFDKSFREMLFQQTQGQPLFTIELMRGLQEQGSIVQDTQGRWVTGISLDWETLPARVEAAIQERIDRLPEDLQTALEVASIEGELFTSEVIARVRDIDERKLLDNLSGELDRKHRLVRAQSIQRVNERLLSRYQFRHILFQKYLYNRIDEVVRVHLHEQVGVALEELYGTQDEDTVNAVQLARHFEEAQNSDKAIRYLYQAGHKASQLSAYQEGIAHLSRGLALLENIHDATERARQELAMQLDLAISWQGTHGAQVKEVHDAFTRAQELCQQLGETAKYVQVLGGLSIVYYVRADYHKAMELAEQAFQIAESTGDTILLLLGKWYMGFILFGLGECLGAHNHFQWILDNYEPEKHHHSLLSLRGSDAGLGAMAYEACCLWCLGYPEQALTRSHEALSLTREFGHPFSLADVLCFAGCMFNSMRKDSKGLLESAEELIYLARERSLSGWLATGIRYRGEAIALEGNLQEGVSEMQKGIEELKSEDVFIYFPGTLSCLAESQAKIGKVNEGLATLEEALAHINKVDERLWEAEIYRLKGELLWMQKDDKGAVSNFNKAIAISQKQSSKSLELRAVTGLARLWKQLGNKSKANDMLSEVYDWFNEGFDTPDLIAARDLLADLK